MPDDIANRIALSLSKRENPLETEINAAIDLYDRLRHLPRIITLWPHELNDFSVEGTRRIVERLTRLQHGYHALGVRQHWSYDVNRAKAIATALRAERRRLVAILPDPQP